jgi:chemotaxis methyl-accepting protein methylase
VTEAEKDPAFEALLDYLKRGRGFDFSGYKRASLMRRVRHRMQAVSIEAFSDYMDYLQVRPEEFTQLFNTILINVTAFFRDEAAWEYLAREIIPRIIADAGDHGPIRVWSAGCPSGEEPYTLAMLLAEALGTSALLERVKIYATDVDEEALAQARSASYTAKDLQPVPLALQEKYFVASEGRYVFRTDLRRSVIFGRHDLVQDAPISRLDLLVCRNTLMYLNGEMQSRILARFHFALDERGYLFLGKAELLLTHANLFTPVDARYRIFNRAPRVNLRDRLLVMAQAVNATNRRGKTIKCLVTCTPFIGPNGERDGVILLTEDVTERENLQQVQTARAFAESIVATVREPLVILDADLRIISANRSFHQTFRVIPEATDGRLIFEIGARQWDIPQLRQLLEEILPRSEGFENYEVTHDFPGIGRRTMRLNAHQMYAEGQRPQLILLAIEDITEAQLGKRNAR